MSLSHCQDRETHTAGNSTEMSCMKERSFFDINILIYTDDNNDLDKQK